MQSFDIKKDLSTYSIEKELQDGIEKKSLKLEFLSDIFNMKSDSTINGRRFIWVNGIIRLLATNIKGITERIKVKSKKKSNDNQLQRNAYRFIPTKSNGNSKRNAQFFL